MPLSEPAERALLHTRQIRIEGYQRGDGLFDIEARLTDVKTTDLKLDALDTITPAGEPVHHMSARMTVDDKLMIHAFEAAMDTVPYATCGLAAPAFERLVGLSIGRGFLKAAAERIGLTEGCTHVRELLQPLATTAVQTIYPQRLARELAMPTRPDPPALNTCRGWRSDNPHVARSWPHLYTGPRAPEE